MAEPKIIPTVDSRRRVLLEENAVVDPSSGVVGTDAHGHFGLFIGTGVRDAPDAGASRIRRGFFLIVHRSVCPLASRQGCLVPVDFRCFKPRLESRCPLCIVMLF